MRFVVSPATSVTVLLPTKGSENNRRKQTHAEVVELVAIVVRRSRNSRSTCVLWLVCVDSVHSTWSRDCSSETSQVQTSSFVARWAVYFFSYEEFFALTFLDATCEMILNVFVDEEAKQAEANQIQARNCSPVVLDSRRNFVCSDSSDSVNDFFWKDGKGHKTRKGATGEDLSDIYKDYSLPSGKIGDKSLVIAPLISLPACRVHWNTSEFYFQIPLSKTCQPKRRCEISTR